MFLNKVPESDLIIKTDDLERRLKEVIYLLSIEKNPIKKDMLRWEREDLLLKLARRLGVQCECCGRTLKNVVIGYDKEGEPVYLGKCCVNHYPEKICNHKIHGRKKENG